MRWLGTALRFVFRASPAGGRRGTLVVQPLQGIGDMIWHLPHIHAIAAQTPERCVTVLTKPRSQADRIFAADPAVQEILWLERNPGRHDGPAGLVRLVALLRRRRFAEAWLLHGSSRYALALALAGIPVTHGYGHGAQRWMLSDPPFPSGRRLRGHPVQMADELLARHHISIPSHSGSLVVSAAATTAVSARFGTLPVPWIGFGIGSSEPYKQWGAANFADLSARLLRAGCGTVFLLGGPAESDMAREIIAGGGRSVIDATDLPLDRTAALLAMCRVYVGNDTGALNVATAVGVTAVGLFGGSKPLTHDDRIRALTPAPAAGGMAAIDVGTVFDAVGELGVLLRS